MMYPASVTKAYYRSGLSFARGTTIDEYLTPEETQALYEKWQKHWPEPFRFSGGISAISCEMVLDVPEIELRKVYGKRLAARFRQAATVNAGR